MSRADARVFALLGDPVAHSLSPAMYTAAFRVLGLAAEYVALRAAADDVPGLVRALTRAGGGGNVTVPHKRLAAASLASPSERVRLLDSCNTFWAGCDGPAGENTDVDGLLAALDELEAPASAWLVLGTGGSAAAVAGAARERGARLAVRSRVEARAEAFARWAESLGVGRAAAGECEVVINATPLGLAAGDPLPAGADVAPAARVALDLVYARGETAWVRAQRARGLRAADGRLMLVAQGAAAFECWFPEHMAPRDVMRAAVERALRA